jgi:2-iminobutanoate/2-iminopropanoate deaminase
VSAPPRRVISTPTAPAAIGPYSQAIEAGGFVFLSGQIPLDPRTGKLIADPAVESQARQCLQNLTAILTGAGTSLAAVVKVTVYITDIGSFSRVNQVYAEFFGEATPARATVEVSALPMGAQVEIDCIALSGGTETEFV